MNLRHTVRLVSVASLACVFAACSGPSVEEHLERADDFKERSLVQEAIIEYRNAIQIDPLRGDVRLLLADAYIETRDLGNALREYVRAADLLPEEAALLATVLPNPLRLRAWNPGPYAQSRRDELTGLMDELRRARHLRGL